MKTHPLRSVDCQLLFKDHDPLDGNEVEALVRKSAEMLGLHPDGSKLLSISADHDIRMICGDLQVLITQSLPLTEKEHLNEAARLQITQKAVQEGLDLLENCHAVTSISVMKGMLATVEFSEDMTQLMGPEIQSFCNAKETMTAMNLAKVISVNMLLKTSVRAVFWAPNNYFLSPQMFSEMAIMDDPTMLYVRPHIYSPIQEVSEKRLIGASAAGSEFLIGRRVEFKPCPLPPAFMVENLMSFVSFCRQRGELLPDGDVFGKNENEKIRMTYAQTGENEPDKIILTVQASAELGIAGNSPPTIYHQYNADGERLSSTVSDVDVSDLDPNDPVDAAILERLRELKKVPPTPQQTKSPVDPGSERDQSKRSSPSPADEMPPVTKAMRNKSGPPTQRTSMKELRSFARQSQAPIHEQPETDDKKGLIGRLFGKK